MKASLPAVLALLLSASPAVAGGYTSAITDTVRLDVQGAGVQSTRTGSSYAVSGTNIGFTGSGSGLGNVTATDAVTTSTGAGIVTPGSAFSFSESIYQGDTIKTSAYTPSSGIISPTVYGNSTVSPGGEKGTLAGSLSAGTATQSVGSITAGGAGTSATLQRSIDLTVFQ
jgi:hypothetical protein